MRFPSLEDLDSHAKLRHSKKLTPKKPKVCCHFCNKKFLRNNIMFRHTWKSHVRQLQGNYNSFMSLISIQSIIEPHLQRSQFTSMQAFYTVLSQTKIPSVEWVALHFNLILSSRMTKFKVIRKFNCKIGPNILPSRLSVVIQFIVSSIVGILQV